MQAQAVRARNDSPSAAIPIPRGLGDEEEGEGDDTRTLVDWRGGSLLSVRTWRGLASRSWSVISTPFSHSQRSTLADRSR